MKTYRLLIVFFVAIFCSSLLLTAQEEPKYTNESFARLSFIDGKAYIQKAATAAFEEGIINMPIEEGDLVGTTDGRAELYLGNNNYVRLDNNTKLEILNLPKKDSDLTRLRIANGNVYVSVNRLQKEKTVEVHSPDVSFYVLDRGLYRIDVRENKKTDVFVFRGVLEAAGAEGSVLLKSEQSFSAQNGRFDSGPTRFLAVAEDRFDRWSDSRESSLRVEVASRYLPEELRDFEAELAEYGQWSYLPSHGWVWVPGGVGADWRPYYNGNWTWMGLCGWTWVPYEPWGWATFHYGRWGWGAGLGWYWMPTSFWGPAWVWWWGDPFYYGWAPLSWWGYPGAVVDGVFYGRYPHSYYPWNSRALTVVHKDQLKAKRISDVAMRSDALKGLDKISLTAQAPALKPEAGQVGKVSLAGAEGKRVFPSKTPGTAVAGPDKGVRATSIRGPERVGYPSTMRPAERSGQTIRAPEERRIRRNDSSFLQGPSATTQGRTTVRRDGIGYPSSPAISIKKFTDSGRGSSSRSIRSRFYNYIQGDRSGSRSTVSRGSSGFSGSRGSISSGSRGASSGSRSSGSRSGGGGVRKKN
jgi:hypothetical protein